MKTTSGLRAVVIWRRRIWKYWAGVEQFAIADIVLGAEQQEALHAGARMLRTLAFITVRQQHDQPAGLAPLLLGRGDELIDHDLRAVGEIAELRFPQRQRLRIGDAVAVLETEHAEFAERTVVDVERRLIFRHVLQRNIALAVFEIVEGEMALAEGAAAGILAAQANRNVLRARGCRKRWLRRTPSRPARLWPRVSRRFFTNPSSLG